MGLALLLRSVRGHRPISQPPISRLMKRRQPSPRVLSLVALVLFGAPLLVAQGQKGDPIGKQLFPPQFLMGNADLIGLTEDQRQALHRAVEGAQVRISPKSEAVRAETKILAELLAAPKVDQAKALKQLGRLSAAESEVKELHFGLLIELRNLLTAEQLGAAHRTRKEQAVRNSPERGQARQRGLQVKVARIQKGMKARQQAGESPRKISELMNQFTPLMQKGRVNEAEAILDRALKMLGMEEAAVEPGTRYQPQLPDPKVRKGVAKSGAEVRAEIAALQEKKPDWREIQWETSLVRGLKRSQQEKKPVILWVFIDRPVDDKRC
jgi:Spy/CpxP family protein refolding chaperone